MVKRTLNIHERFLRHIWSRQYVEPVALKTTENQAVRVLDVGRLNTDSGPDFRNAVIRIGRATYYGDVEIHRTVADWRHHQHFSDPRYNKVILHVVLERGSNPAPTLVSSGRNVPVLVLGQFLSESIRSLWQKAILDDRALLRNRIRCSDQNQFVDPELLKGWIRHLAVERLELKLRRFDERLRELAQVQLLAVHDRRSRWRVQGNPDDLPPPHAELTLKNLVNREFWDQLLYEGVMECLGYSKNQEPFLRLARAVTLQEVRVQRIENNEEALQALLLGAAGLLPKLKTVKDKESRLFVRRLTNEWRTRKKVYRSAILHPADWQFFPTRPANFPTLRIAAATSLVRTILCDDLFRRIIEILKRPGDGSSGIQSLRTLLAVRPLPFWINHYGFENALSKPVHSLGPERTDAVIANAIIPLSLLYARTFKDRVVRGGALRLFESMPPAAENSITLMMQKQLLKERLLLSSVSAQQGVIQLYKFYCREERCAECDVGVALFGGAAGRV
ncbi:MAG: hypothetical protein HW389_887 [Bacteroidetes bacterium]|nr:hypothetical protein [Bacteroidota bacterium]